VEWSTNFDRLEILPKRSEAARFDVFLFLRFSNETHVEVGGLGDGLPFRGMLALCGASSFGPASGVEIADTDAKPLPGARKGIEVFSEPGMSTHFSIL
jgi:hypothetical protein